MPPNDHAAAEDVRITVDGGEFYAFVRALKRVYTASRVGEVVLSVRDGKLTIETKRGGSILPCNATPPVVARVHGGNFLKLINLAADAKASGTLVIVFRPSLGEIGLPHTGTKAKFDKIS
jgi:hypothetical protein